MNYDRYQVWAMGNDSVPFLFVGSSWSITMAERYEQQAVAKFGAAFIFDTVEVEVLA